jgi:DNA polymerase I
VWLIDTYRWNDTIVAWYKDNDSDHFYEYDYNTCIYAESTALAKRCLDRGGITYEPITATDAYDHDRAVLRIDVPHTESFEAFVHHIEQLCKYDVRLYNADIPPAQRWLYDHDVRPYDKVRLDDNNHPRCTSRINEPSLDEAEITIETERPIRSDSDAPIQKLVVDNNVFGGSEHTLLNDFTTYIDERDPDAIFMQHAFRYIPYIAQRIQHHNISFTFHRSHPTSIEYRGGQSFFSYGNVFYRDYAVRLHGRLLIDRNTYLGEDNGIDGIIELAKLSGTRTQHLASRSFGAVTQGSLVRELIQANKLVPHKHKPLSEPMSLAEYTTADKGGHYYDPAVGVHEDVAAIDFSSMFPNLICQYNICAESILNDEQPRNNAPNIPVSMNTETGLLANVLQPIMNQREHYKQRPDGNQDRIQSLKGVLVSSYGYLRYREFKMGLAEAHMAICAYARHHLVEASHIAEEHGATTVHGLVDSLYIKTDDINDQTVQDICDDIHDTTGLPIDADGVLDWVAFLTSKTDRRKPVVTRYFGVYHDGDLCIKGLKAVQQSQPDFIRSFQREAIRTVHKHAPDNVQRGEDSYAQLIRRYTQRISLKSAQSLSFQTKIRKTTYDTNCVQSKILDKLRDKNIPVRPGYTLQYIRSDDGVILPEAYTGNPDRDAYTDHLIDAFHEILQPFNYTKNTIRSWTQPTRQTRLDTYTERPPRIHA